MSFHCQVQIFPRKSVISKLNEFLKTIFIIYIANEWNKLRDNGCVSFK